jgi:S1-C subfamily serine protease
LAADTSQSRDASAGPIAVVVHLSGRFRGKIHRLEGDRFRIGTGAAAEIRFSEDDLTPGLSAVPHSEPYAIVERTDRGFVLNATLAADVWANGRRVEQRVLQSGDVLEIGEGGPVLRFRVYPPGSKAYKSVGEVFSDCAQCLKQADGTVDRAGILLGRPATELLTRTAPWVRVATALALVAALVAVLVLWQRNRELESGLATIRGMAEALERSAAAATADDADVDALRAELEAGLARIDALEDRTGARGRVIASATRSVVFIQGAWGFDDPDGRPLRFVGLLPDGTPIPGPEGPAMRFGGDGPPVEILYTGTGFVAHEPGRVLTNRHVAEPWEYDDSIAPMVAAGLRPRIRRLVGFLPGVPDPFDLTLVRSSDALDVSWLACGPDAREVAPLPLTDEAPVPGDDVVVLGYPAGIAALLARADPATVEALRASGPKDFWQIARALAEADLIAPLATAGVVGQVGSASVVYDAETTHGGSGGPVLRLDGAVVAVNTAILPEFGGSNLGVPASEALRLLGGGEVPADGDPPSGNLRPDAAYPSESRPPAGTDQESSR